MSKASRKEARRRAQQERRAQEEAQRRRGQQTRQRWMVGGGIALIVLVGWVVWASTRPEPTTSSSQPAGLTQTPGATQPPAAITPQRPKIIQVADQGREHVAPAQAHPAYNSNPPTSGWHYAATAPWGFHNGPLQDELVIHNLEHGGIWISYKDDTDTKVVDALVALAREFPRKLIITPRPNNDSPIAVAAWGRLMKLEHYDRAAIVDFYNRFKNKGPEFVPD